MIRTLRAVVAVLVLCLFAGSCFYQSFSFFTPTQVTAGAVFAIEVDADFDAMPVTCMPTAVFQLPNGFDVLGGAAAARVASTGEIRLPDVFDAQLPITFGPSQFGPGWGPGLEANHHLRWFSGGVFGLAAQANRGSLRVYLRAPQTPGTFTLKLALGFRSPDPKSGNPYEHALPVGVSGFATMATPGHVRSIQVVAAPLPPPFALVEAPQWGAGTPRPLQVEVADIDADGRDDLIERYDQDLRVLLSRSSGWLVAATVPLAAGSGAARIADCDGDMFGDLVLASGAVLYGNGGTSWSPGPVLPHGLTAPDVALGDVNGDGRADAVFADATACRVFRGNADRTFTPFDGGLPAATSAQPGRLRVGDLDGDGRAEILLWSLPVLPAQLWHGDGLGSWSLAGALGFADAPSYALDDDPFVFVDLDGDGRREVVRSNSATAYAFTGAGVVPLATAPFGFDRAVALDHDRDDREDLVTTAAAGAPTLATLWRNVGGGSFLPTPLPQSQGFRVFGRALALRTGDLDGDSFPDLAALLLAERPLLWRNTVNGAASYGRGCAGIAGTGFAAPQLSASGTVAPGQSVTLQLIGALPNGPGLLWAGLSKRTWLGTPLLPLGLDFLGATDCHLLTEPSVIVPKTADANGLITHVLPLPPLLPTDTLTFFLQGAVFAPGANAFPFLFSQGLALKMQ
jgi:hypothetical protein